MERIKLREYQQYDFPGILKVWEKTGLYDEDRKDSAEVIERTLKNKGKFFILENRQTDHIIGTCWITNDNRRLYLHHLAIHPSYQDRGYGKLLLLESIKFGKQQNLPMKLEVHKTNKIAIHIYKKMGFKPLGDYHVYLIRDIAKYSALPGLLASK